MIGSLISHYRVVQKLGHGGMGEVYRANDEVLGRTVALKIVSSGRDDPERRRRLLREARAASAVTHPNIGVVYEVDEDNGLPYIAMEYIDGRTLRDVLAQDTMLLPQVLSVGRQIAEALAQAHEKGVVHRDLKPENIMVTGEGIVKVLDFGLATIAPLEAAGGLTEAQTVSGIHTSNGTAVGTVAYMSPEQIRGRPADSRSDLFSLGIILYELATGAHPFADCASRYDLMDAIVQRDSVPASSRRAELPWRLDHLLFRLLCKEPAERYQSARDVIAELDALVTASGGMVRSGAGPTGIFAAAPAIEETGPTATPPRARRRPLCWRDVAGITVAVLVIAAIAVPRYWRKTPAAGPAERHLAVLPFAVAANDPQTAAFSDGLTETLTAKLTQLTDLQALQVAPATDVRAHKVASVEQAGAELGVTFAITGSLQRVGDVVRVNVNLVDVQHRRQVRAETLDAPFSDPFALEDRVVEGVIQMLGLEVPEQARKTLATHGTQVASAYDFYLQGRGYLQNYDKPENIESAIAVFNRALALDPKYALAQAGLGMASWYKFRQTTDPQWLKKTAAACEQALALDGRIAVGHVCLGTLYTGTGRYADAAAEFDRARELEPTSDEAFRGLATAYERLGKLGDAERTYRMAIMLRPHYWASYSWLGNFFYNHARYGEAAQMFEQHVALAPDSYRGYTNLGGIYVLQGRYADAIPILERSVSLKPTAQAYNNLAQAYFNLRRFDEAITTYQSAVRMDAGRYFLWGNLADAYYGTPGRRDKAIDAYRRAVELAQEQLSVNPRDAVALARLADYYAALGDKKRALECLGRALEMGPQNANLFFEAAVAYSRLGQAGTAIDWLEKAVASGYSRPDVRDNPVLDSLRGQSRFQALLPAH